MDPLIHDLERGRGPRRRLAQGDGATGDLFAPVPPPRNGTETSREAARHVAPQSAAMRAQVYDVICAAGPSGVTRSEISAATGIKKDTVNARVSELLSKALIKAIGKRDGEGLLYPTGGR